MIQANELRIGNWYRCRIYNGNSDVIMQFTWQEYKYAHLFDPIPLTTEILEKAGWIKVLMHDGFYTYVKNGIHISMPYFHFSYNDGDSNIELKSLHQLQNLYFALTGEEIEVSI